MSYLAQYSGNMPVSFVSGRGGHGFVGNGFNGPTAGGKGGNTEKHLSPPMSLPPKVKKSGGGGGGGGGGGKIAGRKHVAPAAATPVAHVPTASLSVEEGAAAGGAGGDGGGRGESKHEGKGDDDDEPPGGKGGEGKRVGADKGVKGSKEGDTGGGPGGPAPPG